jgi:hypothetical protein
MIKQARNGGSITPRYTKRIQNLQAQGRMTILTHTTVTKHSYNPDSAQRTITTNPPIPDFPPMDHVYFATGAQDGIKDVELLQTMRNEYPIDVCGPFPALTDDLQWQKDVPLYITGKFASLQLGPGAGNLEGARLGAERVVWAIEELLQPGGKAERTERTLDEQYTAGVGSKFSTLSVE